ncbi:MAG: DNA mismatch repair endonuclease MutL [Elusimicrobiota bacterium]|nr:DNA mismatch repair endonuclease MutL [Elusimicrobiota bacterium]
MLINILSSETINKISAGEVVERPLNVVKEIVENSLDACADTINIEIEQAGKKLIRISDNGVGMDKENLELSVIRYATSKISNFNDLSLIQSFGFRGEALSSIAAVSKLEITTRERGQESAWKLKTEGGKGIEIVPAASAEGLICEVSDLFFNTPVREKFLKSSATEKARITATVEEIALANPDISFKLISDGKTFLSVSKTDKKIDRIADILGKDFAQNLKNLKIEPHKISLDMFYTDRNHPQNNRKFQYLFVNSRPVNLPKWLIACVHNAYRETIAHDKFPGFLFYISIDPAEIDVNIHPTKREIKFSNEQGLYDLIFHVLREALISHSHPNIDIVPAKESSPQSNIYPPRKISDYPANKNSSSNKFIWQNQPPQISPIHIGTTKQYSPEDYSKLYTKQDKFNTDFDLDINVAGQVFDTYIVVEKSGQLYLFDQHAAAERVRYEAYLEQASNNNLKIQQLLIPETFTLPRSLSIQLKSNLEILSGLGLSVEEFGDMSFRVLSYPAILGNSSIENIVCKIAADLENDKNVEIEKKKEIIIRSACRASVKAGDFVSLSEAKKLIHDLFLCKSPFTCPHGRPTAYSISKDQLEKFFKRK